MPFTKYALRFLDMWIERNPELSFRMLFYLVVFSITLQFVFLVVDHAVPLVLIIPQERREYYQRQAGA